MRHLNFSLIFSICGFLLFLSSCKSKEKVFKYETIKSIEETVLIDSLFSKQLIYNTLYFKKISIEFDDNGNSKSVRANLFIKGDSAIIISVIPLMGIEMFRVCIDRNNIRVINRLNKKVIVSDYKYLSDKYAIDVDFDLVLAILTNSLFSYPDYDPQLLKKYSAYHQDEYYSLRSLNFKRFERLSRKNTDIYLHEVRILPGIYKILGSTVVNTSSGISLNVDYKKFTNLNGNNFPTLISIIAQQANNSYRLVFNYDEIILNGPNSINFRIPDSYEVVSY